MQHDQEGQEFRGALVQVPVQQGRKQNGMAEAADGEQFRRALQDRDEDGLESGQEGLAPAVRHSGPPGAGQVRMPALM